MPNGKKICPHLPSQDSPKFTQICILGLKTNHLATLVVGNIGSLCLLGKVAREQGDQIGRIFAASA
jgi:hypothetical protein